MKMYLLMRHAIKENYKYLLTIILAYGFMAVLYHISMNENIRLYAIQLVTYILTLCHALVLPSILFRNYYQQTNASHIASIPMKRLEVFFSLYLVGLGLSMVMIVGYSCLTTLLVDTSTAFIGFSSSLLMGFIYYYHLSLLAFWMCGDVLFQSVVMLVMIFGPFLVYMIYQWALEMYDLTYVVSSEIQGILNLLPGIGCAAYWMGVDPTKLYSLYLNEIVAFFLLTLACVKYRRYERTGQGMVFQSLSYVVRTLIVLLGTATLFAIFGSILGPRDYMSQIIVAIILSVMVVYIVEMIYKKKTKVFYSIKYGIFAAFMVFGSVHLGTKALEGYTPTNFESIVVSLNDYKTFGKYLDEVVIEDPLLIDQLKALNDELLAYYDINEYDVLHHQYFGSIKIEFCKDDHIPFFARRFEYTEQMRNEILNRDMYRDVFFYIITNKEQRLIEKAQQKVVMEFNIADDVYVLDTDTEFYLFENYLKKELLTVLDDENSLFEYAVDSDIYISVEDKIDGYEYIDSQLLYQALSKTFEF